MSEGLDILVEVSGAAHALELLRREQFGAGRFSFNTIVPMPAELDLPLNNFVEDGFDALFGDWSRLSARWMLKEAAELRGYPFPLTSRDQVLDCLNALGEDGERRLALGRRFQSNLERHGHGHAAAWRKEYWGVAADVDEVVAEISLDAVSVAFRCDTPFPRKALIQLSKRYPELRMAVSCASETGKRGRKLVLHKGREIEKADTDGGAGWAAIVQFRCGAGLRWLARGEPEHEWISQIEMNGRGRPVFKGASVAVDFALSRLTAGETPEQLRQRFSALTELHLQALKALAALRD